MEEAFELLTAKYEAMARTRRMKVVLAKRALADLAEIADAIAAEDRRRAVSFVAELTGKCASLAETPEAFAIIGHSRGAEIRRRLHGQYLMFYRLLPHRVFVMRVVYAARDYVKILGLTQSHS